MAASSGPLAPEHRRACMLLAQPSPRLSEGLRGWLQASFDGVFIVADRASLIEGAQRLQPALLVVDVALAEGDLAALLAELQRQAPRSPTLLLSDYDDARIDAAALAAGAAAVVHKASLAAELLPAVEAALAGRRFSAPKTHGL